VPGTGLGLAICRAFVAANGGSVAALSAGPGRGVTMRIRLPLAQGAAAEGAAADD
jgi:two-component system sensor histidine kinase KdpD